MACCQGLYCAGILPRLGAGHKTTPLFCRNNAVVLPFQRRCFCSRAPLRWRHFCAASPALLHSIAVFLRELHDKNRGKRGRFTYKKRKTTDKSGICQSFFGLRGCRRGVFCAPGGYSSCAITLFRHSLGVVPVMDLKVRKKWVSLAKPAS